MVWKTGYSWHISVALKICGEELETLMVLKYRQLTNEVTASLTDIINPRKFKDVLRATKKTAGFDETTHLYRIPSLALKIGHELKKVTLLEEAIMAGDEDLEKQM